MRNNVGFSGPQSEDSSNRTEPEIFLDLEQLCREPGFFHTFCLMVSSYLWMTADEMATTDWFQRPNEQELSLILGLIAKHSIQLDEIPSDEAILQQMSTANGLLEELHSHLAVPETFFDNDWQKDGEEQVKALQQKYDEWMKSGRGTVEPIFYAGSGAYDFQYLEMALRRYAKDEQWMLENKGATLEAFAEITNKLRELGQARLDNFQPRGSMSENSKEMLSNVSFSLDDLPTVNREEFEAFISAFSITPGTVNGEFGGVGDYNEVHARPVMELGNGQYCLPIYADLPESIYESPFYWMLGDKKYRDTAWENRGEATEAITLDLLALSFTPDKVFKGVKVKLANKDITDIDVLAICDNKAIIAQCKSKKLTLEARKGDGRALRNDFIMAVQDAYNQAIKSRKALLQGGYTLTDSNGDAIPIADNVDEAYILCITGDAYPAVITQARVLLEKKETDPHPILLSIFDLDVIAYYLNDQYDLLYYLKQRSTHADYFMANSEMDLLGFHLKHKLFPDKDYDGTMLDGGYAQLIDASFITAKRNLPKGNESENLFHSWKNDAFDELIQQVQLSASRNTDQVSTADLLFFLYDLAGEGADKLINMAKEARRKTVRDGKLHDCRIQLSNCEKGVSFVSFPRPTSLSEELILNRRLKAIASFHKYKSQADEWMVLASIEGSANQFDIFGYIREPWEQDAEMDRIVERFLSSGVALLPDGRMPSRTRSCPCGSGKKFKKCHGKNAA